MSVGNRDRSFVVFSSVVLIALFAAVPCGLIMKEPVSATIATLAGAIFFFVYVLICYKTKHLSFARISISFVIVFIFLPVMFFTNGGVESGTPIWLLLGTIYIAMILDGVLKIVMMICNAVVLTICWVISYYNPGLILQYTRDGNYFDSATALAIVSIIIYLMISFQNNLIYKEERDKNAHRLFEQTAMALVDAIDAKDKYTQGHSSRVAEYSKRIAEVMGKSPDECNEIYYVALLHDVGKIGIPENIINKDGKLTDEEYEIMKQHPVIGARILKRITEVPHISIAANYHHERFDGKGYPMGMKGYDIPEIARIVAVADAYDAMTSYRSYRAPLPKDKVREELIKGTGTQFDPEFANIMLYLIDLDEEYEMKERTERKDISGRYELNVVEHREIVSEGIAINNHMTTITMEVVPEKNSRQPSRPSIILFDSLDGRFYKEERDINEMLYFEYGEMWFDGRCVISGARKTEVKLSADEEKKASKGTYRIEAVRVKDHALVTIYGNGMKSETIVALPDSTRFLYIALTGEHCLVRNVDIENSEKEYGTDYIPRIAEAISYINVPAGDIPNVQVDGYRSDASDGVLIKDGMSISFHTKCLPTARLVWHCPSYVIYTSDDGRINGENYIELSLVRLDGEYWKSRQSADNDLLVDWCGFNGWKDWKKFNREGYDCTITFKKEGNRIISYTHNGGIEIKCITDIKIENDKIYAALSGDQVALTNIRVKCD